MTDTTQSARPEEIWILGASGRIGSAVTANLAAEGLKPVLVGRESDGDRLRKTAADLGSRVVIANGIDGIAAEITRQRPAVVFNGMGNYAETAPVIARACMPGGHYLDLAADLTAVPRLLDLGQEAEQAGSTLVTGSGFGVLATEAVVIKLCEDRPAPAAVRVDALASVSLSAGVVGAAFAASMIDMFATGGRRYTEGRMVTSRLGADLRNLTLPDGEQAKSAGAPTAELLAAHRASNAPSVTVTTGMAPTSRAVRAVAPLVGKLLSIEPLRRFALGRMAKAKMKESPAPAVTRGGTRWSRGPTAPAGKAGCVPTTAWPTPPRWQPRWPPALPAARAGRAPTHPAPCSVPASPSRRADSSSSTTPPAPPGANRSWTDEVPVSHPNTRLPVHGRRLLADRVRAGRPVTHVADDMGISRVTGYKWVRHMALRARIVVACDALRDDGSPVSVAGVAASVGCRGRRRRSGGAGSLRTGSRGSRANDDPMPFVWTLTAAPILESLAGHCQRINDSGH